MELTKLIQEYKNNSLKLHLADDFSIKKKCIEKSNSIIKKICGDSCQDEFFDALFVSEEPFVLADAAHDAFNCCYKLHTCLDIMEHLKHHAKELTFSQDIKKNEAAQGYYSTQDLSAYKKEVKFYDSINNDYLYKKCVEYFRLVVKHINWYYNQNNNKLSEQSSEIKTLLDELRDAGYLEKLFNIANTKYQESYLNLNYLAVNCYYACEYNYNRPKFRKILMDILKVDKKNLTPNLIGLVDKYLEAIDNDIKPDLKTI